MNMSQIQETIFAEMLIKHLQSPDIQRVIILTIGTLGIQF